MLTESSLCASAGKALGWPGQQRDRRAASWPGMLACSGSVGTDCVRRTLCGSSASFGSGAASHSPSGCSVSLSLSLPHPRLFGKLFDETQDIFEALGGTLKAAKKQGLISYSAMILLKGQHDKVPIVLEKEAPEEAA